MGAGRLGAGLEIDWDKLDEVLPSHLLGLIPSRCQRVSDDPSLSHHFKVLALIDSVCLVDAEAAEKVMPERRSQR
jgi:hypothetical protein